jgi:hypothetical protein
MPKYEWPERVTEERARSVAGIIWTIYENGPIEDEEGRATAALMVLLKKNGFQLSGGWLAKTLVDLEDGGLFGKFIEREVVGKRTYTISCVRDPAKDPFPPNPRGGRAAAPVEEEEDEPEVDEGETVDVGEVEVGEDEAIDEIEDFVTVPGMDLEPMAPPSRVDRYLYIVSLLNEMITEEVTAPERRFEEQIGERLTAVNAILEENAKLKKENEGLRDDKRKLAAALEQASSIMRDRAARSANGSREAVTVTA